MDQSRYDHTSEYRKILVAGRGRHRSKSSIENLKLAYNTMLPISEAEKSDLVRLCRSEIIPKELWQWYEMLSTNRAEDRVPEPGAEGDTED